VAVVGSTFLGSWNPRWLTPPGFVVRAGAPDGATPKVTAVAVTAPCDDVEPLIMTRSTFFGVEPDTVVDPPGGRPTA